jgi:hypothetical protein
VEGRALDRDHQIARSEGQAVQLEANVPAAHHLPRLKAEVGRGPPMIGRPAVQHEGADIEEHATPRLRNHTLYHQLLYYTVVFQMLKKSPRTSKRKINQSKTRT